MDKKKKKERLDVLLVQKGYFPSREKAQRSIMAGVVFVDGQRSDKAGNKIDPDAEIEVREDICPYVSRGGFKLEKSMELFPIDLNGKICADIGASTGGFTDCMLQNGASKVYAMDVGYGQLAWKLRTDPRVVNMEKCNVRYLDPALVPDPIDFISVDVSFISLKMIFPTAAKIIRQGGKMVCLVKPQFEAGREQMRGTGGIVRDPAIHAEAIRNVAAYAEDNGFTPKGLTFSPVKGTKGNIEYLLYIEYNNESENLDDIPENSRYNETTVESIVRQSHEDL